jgi:hypothetical protein
LFFQKAEAQAAVAGMGAFIFPSFKKSRGKIRNHTQFQSILIWEKPGTEQKNTFRVLDAPFLRPVAIFAFFPVFILDIILSRVNIIPNLMASSLFRPRCSACLHEVQRGFLCPEFPSLDETVLTNIKTSAISPG